MSRVLVVEDSPTQADLAKHLLEDVGFEVELAANGVEALAAMDRQLPDIVVTDLIMPVMGGIELVMAVRKRFSSVPIIVVTGFGSEEIAALALQAGAASYVPKRYLNANLIATVDNVLASANVDYDDCQALQCLTLAQFEFVLGNDPALVRPVIAQQEKMVAALGLLDQTGLIQVAVALREAFLNAIIHGNLEIGSLKMWNNDGEPRPAPCPTPHPNPPPPVGGGQGRGEELAWEVPDRSLVETAIYWSGFVSHPEIERRQLLAPYRDRRVHFTMKLSQGEVTYEVRDEGPGFDVSQLPDPGVRAVLDEIRGRGLRLIRSFMDEVQHNDAGNQITMIKRGDH